MTTLFFLLQTKPILFYALIGIVSLMVGSFLNVLIYRLPIMMEREWHQQCRDYLALEQTETVETFNLMLPLSRCPNCNSAIKPHQNIPVFSYLFLKGKCANCQKKISLRYPLVEFLTAFLSVIVAVHFGFGWQTVFGVFLTWVLIALTFIDFDCQLLPDSIVLPTLWLGLFLSLFPILADSYNSIIGAISGYLILWTVFQLFKLLTGKEGMGYGDFKLLALFGAWLGWECLPLIILLSSFVGAIIGVGLILFKNHQRHVAIPFGPYLAISGWIALLYGHDLNAFYLKFVGL